VNSTPGACPAFLVVLQDAMPFDFDELGLAAIDALTNIMENRICIFRSISKLVRSSTP